MKRHTQRAQVERATQDFVWLTPQTDQSSVGCKACASNSGCGAASLMRFLNRHASSIKIPQNGNWKAGDIVNLSVSEAVVLRSAALLYGLPILAFMIAACLSSLLGATEIQVIFASLIGIVMGFAVARWSLHRLEKSFSQHICIEAVHSANIVLQMV